MKKIKRLTALALALLFMFNLSLAVSATEKATVTLTGSASGAVAGGVYEVTLNVAETDIGGVEGVVCYDTNRFDFRDVTMYSSMAKANRLTSDGSVVTAGDIIKADETSGEIKFALIADGVNTEWVTFNFVVLDADEVSVSDFELKDVVASNDIGTETVDSVSTSGVKDVAVSKAFVTMEGSSIRTDGTYDLRFETTISSELASEIKKVGMILIPTALIAEGKEILNDKTGESFCVAGVTPNIAVVDFNAEEAATDDYKFYGNILRTGATHMNREYSLRTFVILNDGSIVYCDDDSSDNSIIGGAASRSCRTTAIAIYNSYKELYKDTYTYSDDIAAIINKAKWTSDEYTAVVDANLEAYTSAQ